MRPRHHEKCALEGELKGEEKGRKMEKSDYFVVVMLRGGGNGVGEVIFQMFAELLAKRPTQRVTSLLGCDWLPEIASWRGKWLERGVGLRVAGEEMGALNVV